jgi:hypothetical protein
LKDSEFLKLIASGYVLESTFSPDDLGLMQGQADVVKRLLSIAEDAERRERLLARYPEAKPELLVKLVLPEPMYNFQGLTLRDRFPHFAPLLEEGYGLAEFMAFADAAMGENYAMFIEYATATGCTQGVRTRPWYKVLEDLRETEVQKIRRALASALSKEFPDKAARIAIDLGYSMGVEDASDD